LQASQEPTTSKNTQPTQQVEKQLEQGYRT